jgi:hypothetical protein
MIDPHDDIVQWDVCGTEAGDFTHGDEVVRVGDRNEPNPYRWLPHDPFGPERTTGRTSSTS